ncbi:Far-red impaired responsive family protein isoform 1 [Hibiscus syriacus]|uniref:Far-red impaired responsive family protein isoform 1 n=1 Tax=Hibiscus syriacus TaxID=106335 RepID=A0A6A3BN32_HIBSY|nr:Far-red impaired responsive family protein isoform 1 [Hibiscus syriacus]
MRKTFDLYWWLGAPAAVEIHVSSSSSLNVFSLKPPQYQKNKLRYCGCGCCRYYDVIYFLKVNSSLCCGNDLWRHGDFGKCYNTAVTLRYGRYREPCTGMVFESAEDAREFYEIEYAKKETRVSQSRPVTREGCNAMLRIAAKGGGKWVVYGFVKEHNHELNPSKIPPRRSHRIVLCELSFLQLHPLRDRPLDEKDLKIREFSSGLHCEKKKCAAYQEQLKIVLKYIEEHTRRLSLKLNLVSNNLRELKSED